MLVLNMLRKCKASLSISLQVVIDPCHSLTKDGFIFIFNFSIAFIGLILVLKTMQVSNFCPLHRALIAKAVSFCPHFPPFFPPPLSPPSLWLLLHYRLCLCVIYVLFSKFLHLEIDDHFKLLFKSLGYKDKEKPFQDPI